MPVLSGQSLWMTVVAIRLSSFLSTARARTSPKRSRRAASWSAVAERRDDGGARRRERHGHVAADPRHENHRLELEAAGRRSRALHNFTNKSGAACARIESEVAPTRRRHVRHALALKVRRCSLRSSGGASMGGLALPGHYHCRNTSLQTLTPLLTLLKSLRKPRCRRLAHFRLVLRLRDMRRPGAELRALQQEVEPLADVGLEVSRSTRTNWPL